MSSLHPAESRDGAPGETEASFLKRIVQGLALMAVAATIALVVAELAVGALYPRSERHYVLPPDGSWEREPDPAHLPGISSRAVFSTSSLGIRGPEFAGPEEFRILAIGGSTTENFYLDDSATWPRRVGELLGSTADGRPTWSGDVGRSGMTARNHVLHFKYLLEELPRIDLVVILVGVNDLTAALQQGADYEPAPPLDDGPVEDLAKQRAFIKLPGSIRAQRVIYDPDGVPAYKRLALYQLLGILKAQLNGNDISVSQDGKGSIYSVWRSNRAQASQIIDQLPDLSGALTEYRSYLESLVQLSREYGVRTVFVTQPSLWRAEQPDYEAKLLWLGGLGVGFQGRPGGEYYSTGVLREAMDAYNRVLMDVSESTGTEYVDLSTVLPRDTTVFYDDIHYTEKGSTLIAEILADYLGSRPPYSRDGT